MSSRVWTFTSGLSRKARETVECETCAARAMSLMETIGCERRVQNSRLDYAYATRQGRSGGACIISNLNRAAVDILYAPRIHPAASYRNAVWDCSLLSLTDCM